MPLLLPEADPALLDGHWVQVHVERHQCLHMCTDGLDEYVRVGWEISSSIKGSGVEWALA